MITTGMITVRTDSSRLPSKCLLQFDNNLLVLEHVIERCINANIEPIVATTTETSDNVIVGIARSYGIHCYRGSTNDKMQRWLSAADNHNIRSFVAIDCDDPLFDIELTHKIHSDLFKSNYDYIFPNMNAYLGSHGMAVNVDALRKSVELKESQSTEMIENHIHENALTKIFDIVVDDIERDIRLTLDYQEDWWLIQTIVRELGENATRNEIVTFFKSSPGLSKINLFRNKDWRQHRL